MQHNETGAYISIFETVIISKQSIQSLPVLPTQAKQTFLEARFPLVRDG